MLQHVQHVANTESSGKRGRAERSTVDEVFFFIRTVPIFSGIHCVSRGFQGQLPLFSFWSTSMASTWPNRFICTDSKQAKTSCSCSEIYNPINEERQWYHTIFHCPSDNPTYSQTSYIFNMYMIIYRYILHYITIQYNTLRYITLSYLRCVALHELHCIFLHYITLHHLTLHYITWISYYFFSLYLDVLLSSCLLFMSYDPWCCYIWCAMDPINIPPLC